MNQIEKMPFTAAHPENAVGPISVEPYLSQDYYEKEIETIFKTDWLAVGRDEELPKPGDYKVKRLDFANTSVILIRGKDNVVRGFHNVCRHRGNKVVTETGGEETFGSNRAAVVTCRFHGWVYNAKGELVNVPGEQKFPDCFDRNENGLLPIHTETWSGFIFINLASKPAKSLVQFLDGAAVHLDGYPFHTMPYCYTYRAHLKCNWKTGIDAFSEAYHVPTIHSGSFPGLTNYWQGDVAFYGDHRGVAFYSSDVNPPTPVGDVANRIFSVSIALPKNEPFPLPKTINPKRDKYWGFEATTLFPNYLVHVAEGLWFTHQFWPVSQDQCLWEGRYYVPPPKTNSQVWAQRYAVLLQRNAWLEDTGTMEDTQAAISSGMLKEFNLQDDEIMIQHAYNVIDARVKGK